MNLSFQFASMSVWAKILLIVSLGKAFVAGAGLGLAALGIVDLASTLGVKPLVDFIQREHIMEVFAFGGGIASVAGQIASIIWKVITR